MAVCMMTEFSMVLQSSSYNRYEYYTENDKNKAFHAYSGSICRLEISEKDRDDLNALFR